MQEAVSEEEKDRVGRRVRAIGVRRVFWIAIRVGSNSYVEISKLTFRGSTSW
jgi:hypothetical protein